MTVARSPLCIAGLAAACLISACQGPSAKMEQPPLAGPSPGETDFKKARYAAAIEGLHFVDGLVEVE
ncbi:MAG: hypothetical protein ACYS0D_11800, partial [Planctomycetota bacterium]